MEISPIPAFDDNYIWLIRNGCDAAVVDPGDEGPVLERLQREGLQLTAILITHKHGDHTGGVKALKQAFPGISVYGPVHEAASGVSHRVSEGDSVEVAGAKFQVWDVPGHTEGHVAYYGEGVLFCGDTLFAAGCGRVFSGTHRQLHDSLRRIAALPPETLCYPAHEYTLANLGFAKWVEPENLDILSREAEVLAVRDQGRPTLPAPLSVELATNPFLRTDKERVIRAAEKYAGCPLRDGAEIFTALRTWKDKEYD
ncbi:MAG: hydroxyacylglutathione hydrolase [Gammaproteobacteria bacterium]|nr:hydroxyacylglutathione hydrolase [Gammaproteobacteria bacterium]MBU1655093.1 hydroxyacylglutathione hydrolase [Gammaproteobacteria bacterium]MBU1961565.1 hydroxyacylglutathione hydrolase [Gammaproteobacteria bacterium]